MRMPPASPLPPRGASRVVGRGRGWGAAQQTRRQRCAPKHPHPRPLPTAARGEGRRKNPRRRCTQFHQRRQEPGQRLAGAGRCDQQRRAVVTGLFEQIKLMLARRPSARREPFFETVGQQRVVRQFEKDLGRHAPRGKRLEPLRRGRRRKSPRPACGERHRPPLAAVHEKERRSEASAMSHRRCDPGEGVQVYRWSRLVESPPPRPSPASAGLSGE